MCVPRRDVEGPCVEGLRLRRPAPQDGDGDLNQKPAHAGRPRLGDVAAALCLPRTELARYQAEVGFDLVRVAEALGVIEGGDEGGGHGPDAGDGSQVLNTRIVSGHARDRPVGIRKLGVEVPHDLHLAQRASHTISCGSCRRPHTHRPRNRGRQGVTVYSPLRR